MARKKEEKKQQKIRHTVSFSESLDKEVEDYKASIGMKSFPNAIEILVKKGLESIERQVD